MGVIESAVAWAIEIANDPKCGYSQTDRWGPPDFDCSSYIISAYEHAGVPLREAGASYTRNMRGPMIACGFVDVTHEVGIDTGYGIQPGDVLLNYAAHTCMSVGGGKVANCRTDEGHPQPGDQGQEIRIQPYWNGSPNRWNCVLRYKGSHVGSNVSGQDTSSSQSPRTNLRKGMRGDDVKELQKSLNALGYSCGEPDGIFGNRTYREVILFQEDHGLEVDGVAGRQTKDAIAAELDMLADNGSQTMPDPDESALPELPDLSTGSRGDAVVLLQAALNLRGFNCGTADGVFGAKTAAALNRFKESVLLTPDGIANAKVWTSLLTELIRGVEK